MQHSNIVMEHCVKKDKGPALGLYDNGTKAWPKDTQDTDSDWLNHDIAHPYSAWMLCMTGTDLKVLPYP